MHPILPLFRVPVHPDLFLFLIIGGLRLVLEALLAEGFRVVQKGRKS